MKKEPKYEYYKLVRCPRAERHVKDAYVDYDIGVETYYRKNGNVIEVREVNDDEWELTAWVDIKNNILIAIKDIQPIHSKYYVKRVSKNDIFLAFLK